MKNVLRTHTTAVSAKMLYKLAQQKEFKPTKYFRFLPFCGNFTNFLSIDRVFRNETLDATHLAEFHQVEGLIADYDVSLADLIGVLNTFFQKLGIKKLKFKVIIYIKLKIVPFSACFQPIHGTLNGDLLVS